MNIDIKEAKRDKLHRKIQSNCSNKTETMGIHMHTAKMGDK